MTKLPAFALATLALLAGCEVSFLDFELRVVVVSTSTTGTGGKAGTGGAGGTGGGGMLCTPGAMASCYDGPPGTEGVGICKAGTKTCASDGSSWGPCVGEVLPLMGDCATGMDQACDGGPTVCKGSTVWAERFGNVSDQQGSSIATDAAGNVLVTGFVRGAVDFGLPTKPLTSAGGDDIFVAKLDPTGALLWTKLFGDADHQEGTGITADALGNVLVTGAVSGKVDFGNGSVPCTAGDCIFVAKLDPTGAPLWGKVFGSAQYGAGLGIAVDSSGNVFVTGLLSGSVDFGSPTKPLTSAGGYDIFVAKFDPGGTPLWSKLFGDASDQEGTSIAVDTSGNVLLTGRVSGSVDFGSPTAPLKSAGGDDIFVAKLDPGGTPLWSKLFGDASDQEGTSIATDAMGNVLVTGFVAGSVDFGSPTAPLTSAGGDDIFVAKLDPGGTPLWSEVFGDGDSQQGMSITVDPSSNIVVTGSFSGAVDFGSNTGSLASAGLDDTFVAKFKPDGTALWSKRFGDPTNQQAGRGIATDTSSNVFVTGYIEGTVDFGIPPPLTSMGGEDIFVAKLSP